MLRHHEYTEPRETEGENLDIDKLYEQMMEGNGIDLGSSHAQLHAQTQAHLNNGFTAEDIEKQRNAHGRSIATAKKQLQKSLDRVERVFGIGRYAPAGTKDMPLHNL